MRRVPAARKLLFVTAALLGGCVTVPERIAPQKQPPELYRTESCQRLTDEQARLSRELADAEDQQRAAHDRSVRVAETLGVVPILGPTENRRDEIAAMKGQLLAMAAVGEEKSCRLRKVDLNDPDLRHPQEAAGPPK